MTLPSSAYSFLPWLRQGIANRIQPVVAGDVGQSRATINIELQLTGDGADGAHLTETIAREIQLYGPGDVIGIDIRAIIKTEPRDWITNFEPNYLAYIDFYDEDFPWRYTPELPDTTHDRLRPWIALAVLQENTEFAEGKDMRGKPLPYITITNPSTFLPAADQLWAWAHVQVNRDLAASLSGIDSSDTDAVLANLQDVLSEDPDLAYSRIICPRRLEANKPFHAFLIPVFESGRLAGLGLDPAHTPAVNHTAWEDYPPGAEAKELPDGFPYYHRWYFRTGTVGDFEYLVRLLQPKSIDARVGRRDIDVQSPYPNLQGINDPALGGVLKLGGALQVPVETMDETSYEAYLRYENWAQPYPHRFQRDLASFVNLADDYSGTTPDTANRGSGLGPALSDDPDPLITPPLYGRWHALTSRLLTDRTGSPLSPDDNWVHELNLDPRFRVAAGFGTKVVQQNQEAFMNAAWEQLGQVLEANRRIRLAQMARAAAMVWHEAHLQPLQAIDPQLAFMLTAPVHSRVVSDGLTVLHQVRTSTVPRAIVSTQARRMLRPGGRLMKSLAFSASARPDNLVARINSGEVTAAPSKVVPPGLASIGDVSDALLPGNAPAWIVDALRGSPRLRFIALVLAVFIVLLVVLLAAPLLWLVIGLAVAATLSAVFGLLSRWAGAIRRADQFREENQTPESVDALPRSPDFVISEPGSGIRPRQGRTDSPEAVRFKAALRESLRMVSATREVTRQPARLPIALTELTSVVVHSINPAVTIPRRVLNSIVLPARVRRPTAETFQEVMAYPEINLPMYRPLSDISSELFLPNISLVEQNSISLLENNQEFLEAYMVGLNHEFARELLWREYPTDQRGSYFRQFWDVTGYLDTEHLAPEILKEKLRDIPPLHHWSKRSMLGQHNHRAADGGTAVDVVLVIRGEVLKKYPTAVIYAQKGEWQMSDGRIDPSKERRLVSLEGYDAENPPRDRVKTPLYEAKVEPDIYFFGFDLTVEAARGGTGEPGSEEPGWFFVIQERPSEVRFGMHLEREDAIINVWNDLAWPDILPPDPAASLHIPTGDMTHEIHLTAPPASDEKYPQYVEDQHIRWYPGANSAEIAYILYQAPVMVAVHASEMLPRS